MLTTNQIRKVNFCSLCLSIPEYIFFPWPAFSDFCVFLSSLSQDLSSPNQYDTGVALTGLSCFVTPDLARDLANDIMTLVSYGQEV